MNKQMIAGLAGFVLLASVSATLTGAPPRPLSRESAGVSVVKEPVGPPKIKVLIAKKKPGVLLEVKGKYKVYDPHTKEHISTRFIGKRKYMQPMAQGLKWGEEFPGVYQLMIMPDDARTTTLVDGIEYRGSIYIYDVEGQLSVVNEVEIEDYLSSIMATQTNKETPEEVLGALAIANRTQTYYQAGHPKTSFWDVDGEKMGYEGFAAAQSASLVAKSLQTTKYMVLIENEIPFDAGWAKACLSLPDAERLAKQGQTAADILGKAFPGASIKVMLNNK